VSSQSRNVSCTCPYCGHEFETEVFDTIEAGKDPDLRDRCLSGDLFRVTCPHCQKEYMFQYPLLYVDRERGFVLLLSQEPMPSAMASAAAALDAKHFLLRRCPTLKEFSEKIQMLEDGADDRVVELAKYDSFIECTENRGIKPEEVEAVEYQSLKNEVMKINVRLPEGRGMGFMIPLNALQEEFDQDRDLYKVNNASFPVVNGEWMRQRFTDKTKS
jgi:hypothetical protein